MYTNIIAFDYETANASRTSACAIGAVRFDLASKEETAAFYTLIDPEEYFDDFNVMIHGITLEMVEGAPLFPEAMYGVFAMADEGTLFVAHNTGFDMSVMCSAAAKYDISLPDMFTACTYRISKALIPGMASYTLPDVSEHFGITDLEHHNAESDARTCGKIFLGLLEGAASVDDLLASANLKLGVMKDNEYSGIHVIRHSVGEKRPRAAHNIEYVKGENSPFYQKTVAFTGAMQSMTRDEAFAIIEDIGGTVTESVSKKIDYLVTGWQDPRVLKGHPKSSKLLTVDKLVAKGFRIEVINEDEFLKML